MMNYTSIIAGNYKGTKLKTCNQAQIRPTQSRVRKGIFDTITELSGLKVLDLFAGAGTFGFEAISRGASSVTFVDHSVKSIKMLKFNRHFFNGCKIRIIRNDVFSYLKGNVNSSYDIIFADPPYGKINLEHLHSSAFEILSEGGTLLIEYSVFEKWYREDSKTKKYGDTLISYFYKES